MGTVRNTAAMVLLALALAMLGAGAASAGGRMALVIGNSAYRNAGTLPNTLNDAEAMAALFRKIGFDSVDVRRNVDVVEFKRAVRDFLVAADNADVAVVYYSGHGMEVDGTNYLIPVDAQLGSDYDAEDEAISLERIIQAVQPARHLRLIILDACRDNPFPRTSKHVEASRDIVKGLAPIDPGGADTLIAYAAKAGSVSFDGTGKNSPFTSALVKYLAEPGLDIRLALGRVRDDVLAQTGNRQEPFYYGSLGGSLVSLVPAPQPVTTEPPLTADVVMLREYEVAERVGTQQAWESFLKLHPSGFYSDLAREQLRKLVAAEPAVEPSKTTAALDVPPVGAPAPQPATASVATNPAAPGPRETCRAEEEELARLRANPTAEDVARFARELSCDALRPQVQRLAESLGVDLAPVPPPQQAASLEPAPSPVRRIDACKTETEQLVQLRAHLSRDDVQRFAHSFTCEELRPQINRLLESFGIGPVEVVRSARAASPPSAAQSAPGASIQMADDQPATAKKEDQRLACTRDQQTLVRLRSNPDPQSVARFVQQLQCEKLRPQAARLLESVGE